MYVRSMTATVPSQPLTSSSSPSIRCGLYARMSKDNPHGTGRQLEDMRKRLDELGWAEAGVYIDEGVPASDKRRVRPGYQRLLADVRAGKLDAVLCWDQDRLLRLPRELEDWVDLADDQGTLLDAATHRIDLASPTGIMAAGVKGQMSRMEVRQLKLRLGRSLTQRAERGKPHGRVPYGWTAELLEIGRRIDSRGVERITRARIGDDRIDPAAAEIIQTTAQRLLAGESLRSLCRELNTRGVPSPMGRRWVANTMRDIMVRESNAGRRVHKGQVVGSVIGRPALVDPDIHDRVVALLNDPSRRTNPGRIGRPNVHLLSGLARCGKCQDGPAAADVPPRIVRLPGRKADPARGIPAGSAGYTCSHCFGLRRKQADVDAYVSQEIVTELAKPGAAGVLAGPDYSASVAAAQQELATLLARLELAADKFGSGVWTDTQVDRLNAQVLPRIDALQAEIRASLPRPELSHMTGPGAAAAWESATLEIQRVLVDILCTVTLLPVGKGSRKFSADSVRIDWKH